jgi:hypothetical protein
VPLGCGLLLLGVFLIRLIVVPLVSSGEESSRAERGPHPFESQIPSFVSAVEGIVGERDGGVWISTDTPAGEIVVGVVGPTREDRAALMATAPAGATIKVMSVEYSLAELRQFAQAATPMVTNAVPGAVQMFGPRRDLNKVEITLRQDEPALVQQLETVIPADALQVTIDPQVSWVAG